MGNRRLTADEGSSFLQLLRRYCEFEVDQFDFLRVPTSYGDVYVDFKRQPSTDVPLESYKPLPESPSS